MEASRTQLTQEIVRLRAQNTASEELSRQRETELAEATSIQSELLSAIRDAKKEKEARPPPPPSAHPPPRSPPSIPVLVSRAHEESASASLSVRCSLAHEDRVAAASPLTTTLRSPAIAHPSLRILCPHHPHRPSRGVQESQEALERQASELAEMRKKATDAQDMVAVLKQELEKARRAHQVKPFSHPPSRLCAALHSPLPGLEVAVPPWECAPRAWSSVAALMLRACWLSAALHCRPVLLPFWFFPPAL